MKIFTLILMLISFQFFITGCSGGVFFGDDQPNTGQSRSSIIAPGSLGDNISVASDAVSNKMNNDNEPTKPSAKFIIPPGDSIFGVDFRVEFEILRGDNDIIQMNCYVNDRAVHCHPQGISATGSITEQGSNNEGTSPAERRSGPVGGTIDLGPMEPGTHQLRIEATDKDGNTHQVAEEDWTVYNSYTMESQLIQVPPAKNKIDILFVIDNSWSMRYEQGKLGDGFKNFIAQLKGLDWRIGITTTDGSKSNHYLDNENVTGDASPELVIANWRDGRLAYLYGAGLWATDKLGSKPKYHYLTPNIKDVQKVFSKNIRRKELDSEFEQGIYTTYRAIERAVANNGNVKENRILNEFFRKDAALAVVVISDEDDSGSEARNKPENLIAHVKRSFGEDKIFQFHSIIAHTQSCIDGKGKAYGYNYAKLSRLTGGIVGNICLDKYDNMLATIGSGLSNLTKTTYQMKCAPQDIDNDGLVNLGITPRNSPKNPGYIVKGSHIQFEQALKPGGSYDLVYYCL